MMLQTAGELAMIYGSTGESPFADIKKNMLCKREFVTNSMLLSKGGTVMVGSWHHNFKLPGTTTLNYLHTSTLCKYTLVNTSAL